MSEPKQPWTPGPWEASQQDRVLSGPLREEYANWIIVAGDGPDDDEGWVVAVVCNEAGKRTEANARLFAAAPDLAKALAKFVLGYEGALRRRGGQTAPADPPVIASARAALDACGWQWGGR
jgi:hypothetical protein